MTPAQRHREDTFRRHADEWGQLSCYFAEEGGCRGRLQAAHIIAAFRLKVLRANASIRVAHTGERPDDPLLATDLDDLLADGRNGVAACERHHHLHEGPVLHCLAPPAFYEFVADYGLEHVVENARSAA